MSAQDILVVAETKQDALADITLELLGGARKLASESGGKVVAVVLSADGSRYAGSLSAADRIVLVNDPALAGYSPGPFVAALEGVIRQEQPLAVLIGSTSIGWDLAPLLGGRLDAPVAIGCQKAAVEGGAVKATCSICGGKILADVQLDGSPAVLLIMSGSFQPAESPGQAEVETRPCPVPLEAGPVVFEEMILPEAGDVDITAQDVLVGVGRGVQNQDDLEIIGELARELGGELCASRPVVDQGWLPTTRQVGKSGMVVKPKLYLALGISGAPEHQEGMQGSDLVIAINTDPKAPIFDIATFGVEMDLMDLVEPLAEAIRAKRG